MVESSVDEGAVGGASRCCEGGGAGVTLGSAGLSPRVRERPTRAAPPPAPPALCPPTSPPRAAVIAKVQQLYLSKHEDRTIKTILLLVGARAPPPPAASLAASSPPVPLAEQRSAPASPPLPLLPPPSSLTVQRWRPRLPPWCRAWGWRATTPPASRRPRPASHTLAATGAPTSTSCALVGTRVFLCMHACLAGSSSSSSSTSRGRCRAPTLTLASRPPHPPHLARQVQGHGRGQRGHSARGADHLPGYPGLQARHCDQHRHRGRVSQPRRRHCRRLCQHRHAQPRPADTHPGACQLCVCVWVGVGAASTWAPATARWRVGPRLTPRPPPPPPSPARCPTPAAGAQGFDKYGIGLFESMPTPHLQHALGLKSGGWVVGGQRGRGGAGRDALACATPPPPPPHQLRGPPSLPPPPPTHTPRTGVVSSGNSLDYTTEDMESMTKSGAAVKVRWEWGVV